MADTAASGDDDAIRAPRAVTVTWNRWAPDALQSPLAPAELVDAYNRWQPDHLKIRRA